MVGYVRGLCYTINIYLPFKVSSSKFSCASEGDVTSLSAITEINPHRKNEYLRLQIFHFWAHLISVIFFLCLRNRKTSQHSQKFGHQRVESSAIQQSIPISLSGNFKVQTFIGKNMQTLLYVFSISKVMAVCISTCTSISDIPAYIKIDLSEQILL